MPGSGVGRVVYGRRDSKCVPTAGCTRAPQDKRADFAKEELLRRHIGSVQGGAAVNVEQSAGMPCVQKQNHLVITLGNFYFVGSCWRWAPLATRAASAGRWTKGAYVSQLFYSESMSYKPSSSSFYQRLVSLFLSACSSFSPNIVQVCLSKSAMKSRGREAAAPHPSAQKKLHLRAVCCPPPSRRGAGS